MYLNRCCCCLSVKTGTYIIGCLHILSSPVDIFMLEPEYIALHFFIVGSFLTMVYRDSAVNRMYYFAAYCCFCVLNVFKGYTEIVNKRHERRAAMSECEAIKA